MNPEEGETARKNGFPFWAMTISQELPTVFTISIWYTRKWYLHYDWHNKTDYSA